MQRRIWIVLKYRSDIYAGFTILLNIVVFYFLFLSFYVYVNVFVFAGSIFVEMHFDIRR